jgi:hypothetical protein
MTLITYTKKMSKQNLEINNRNNYLGITFLLVCISESLSLSDTHQNHILQNFEIHL